MSDRKWQQRVAKHTWLKIQTWKIAILYLSIVVAGCAANSPRDLRFVSAEARDVNAHPEIQWLSDGPRGSHFMIAFSVSTREDLAKVAKRGEYLIESDARLCRSDRNLPDRIPSSHMYWGNFVVGLSTNKGGVYENLLKQHIPGDPFVYKFYFAIQHPGDSGSAYTFSSYDLLEKPEDVCLQVKGANFFGNSFSSNEIVIPKESVEAALRRASLTPEGRKQR
jgi:hypothetical protein